MNYELLLGDCIETMRSLPSESVQCVVTSPPYYGLRDYGTASWEGGDAECDHVEKFNRNDGDRQDANGFAGNANREGHAHMGAKQYRDLCAKCGARRVDNQIGLEETPEAYVAKLVEVFREVRRLLRDDGTLWLNLGDSYSGSGGPGSQYDSKATNGYKGEFRKYDNPNRNVNGLGPKQLLGIPWRVAFALQADGWVLRSAITWCKGNPMPESVSGSRYIRHRVTIEEYENLSNLRSEYSGNHSGTRDLSSLQAGAGIGGQTPLSSERERAGSPASSTREGNNAGTEAPLPTEREGTSNGAGAGTARGREGEAATSQPFSTRAAEQSQVRSNGKGQGYAQESFAQVSCQRQSQADRSGTTSENERFAFENSTEASCELALCSQPKGEGKESPELRQPQGGNSARATSDSRGLAGNLQATQESLLLLQEAESANARPRDTHQQGRIARQGKHSASLPELQLEEEGQFDSSLLVDCPGCPKCEANGGYIYQESAGRPTKATEQIFLLSKSPSYFYDSEAIKTDTGANRRDWWHINTHSYAQAHFATFPEALVEPMILAGTSARGCCAKCGSPWARVVEGGKYIPDIVEVGQRNVDNSRGDKTRKLNGKSTEWREAVASKRTTGWQPTCTCQADVVPCTVLDPFSGSGTVGAVALKHGRKYIGCELNPEYIELAHRRIQQSQPMLLQVTP